MLLFFLLQYDKVLLVLIGVLTPCCGWHSYREDVRERETFGMNMDEEEAGLERNSGGGEAQSFCEWEGEKNGRPR